MTEKKPLQNEVMEKRVKTLWERKKKDGMDITFEKFKKWYMSRDQKCCYCGITEEKIKQLMGSGRLTKRNRGKTLELERKNPDKGYDDLNNLALACYWCNNAKTDTFTAEEFKLVGKAFGKIWKSRGHD